jgi:hypothetical protein
MTVGLYPLRNIQQQKTINNKKNWHGRYDRYFTPFVVVVGSKYF